MHLVRCSLPPDPVLAKEILDAAVRLGAQIQHPLELGLMSMPRPRNRVSQGSSRLRYRDLSIVSVASLSCRSFNDLEDLAEVPFPARMLSASSDRVATTASAFVTFKGKDVNER